jgi:hypothetical protein
LEETLQESGKDVSEDVRSTGDSRQKAVFLYNPTICLKTPALSPAALQLIANSAKKKKMFP